MALRSLSLCAGVGGLDLAVHLVLGRGRMVSLGHCEREAHAAAVLVARMEDAALDPAPVWRDLETFPCGLYRDRVDIVLAGDPCVAHSSAGKRLGEEDGRTGKASNQHADLKREAAGWPTPSAQSYERNRGGAKREGPERPSLDTIAKGWPNRLFGRSPTTPPTPAGDGSRSTGPTSGLLYLNPSFDEWLMGFPTGWTDCECAQSATRFSRWWELMRSELSSLARAPEAQLGLFDD